LDKGFVPCAGLLPNIPCNFYTPQAFLLIEGSHRWSALLLTNLYAMNPDTRLFSNATFILGILGITVLFNAIVILAVLGVTTLISQDAASQSKSYGGKSVRKEKGFVKDTATWEINPIISACYVQVKASTIAAFYYRGAPYRKPVDGFVWMNYGEEIHGMRDEGITLPAAARVQLQANLINLTRDGENLYDILVYTGQLDEVVANMLRPFYFKKTEVTNNQYREFVQWVEAESEQKGFERFEYTFSDPSSEVVQKLGSDKLSVFPDTTVWTKDFQYSFNEPMNNHYNWHPAYDDYPVVGVSWFQAMAFIDWLQEHKFKGAYSPQHHVKLTYSLPSDLEWELVLRSQGTQEEHRVARDFNADVNWITDLMILSDPESEFKITNPLVNTINPRPSPGNFTAVDGYFHTCKADQEQRTRKHANNMYLSSIGVSCMGGNVSEWMEESYSAYKPVYAKRQELMKKQHGEAYKLAVQLEDYFDRNNDENGQLVRGSNWYDQRFADQKPAAGNRNGATQKVFISPERKHSTVGFRYVIRAELEAPVSQ
jgi:formylglycine-generating enzyme required for sulfatase activity